MHGMIFFFVLVGYSKSVLSMNITLKKKIDLTRILLGFIAKTKTPRKLRSKI